MSIRMTPHHTEMTFQYMRIQGEPETLLAFLLRRFHYLDQEEWLENIEQGRLLVDRKQGQPLQILRNNQAITYCRPDFLEPPVDDAFEVLYEDQYLVAFNKSGNLPTSPSGKYYKNTLVYLAKQRFGWEKLYSLHRLDRETSGVILFAKRQQVAQIMAEQFRKHQIQKKYTGILHHPLPDHEVFLSVPIGRDPHSAIRIKQGANSQGRPCQTYFRYLKHWGPYIKAEIQPLTGRTHQIRVHAAYMGNPIVGDKLYGLKNDGFIRWREEGDTYLNAMQFPIHRQLLHAFEIRFSHPVTNKAVVIQADDQSLTQTINFKTGGS